MYCGKCGSKLEKGSLYCPYCGNRIGEQNERDKIEKEVKIDKTSEEEIEIIEIEENKLNGKVEDNDKIVNNSSMISSPLPDNYDSLKNGSLILGISSILCSALCFLSFPFAIAGICLGVKYKNKSNNTCSGFVLSIIGLFLTILIVVLIFGLGFATYNIKKSKPSDTNVSDKYNYDSYYDGDKYDDYYSDKDDSQVIGNEKFGYLTIPNDWTLYKISSGDGTLQYSHNNTWILSLYAIEKPYYSIDGYADNIENNLKEYGASNVTTTNDYVGEYIAIKKTTYITSLRCYMTTWCFADEYGDFHYIALSGPTRYSDNYDIVDTFKLYKENRS